MDFFTQKELNGLKGDLKAREIAINAEKESFQKKLLEQYGKEMKNSFEAKKTIPQQTKEKKKVCWIKRLFSI